MGNIPEFITRQLPSSAVGTLGVDPNAGVFGEGVARLGAGVANIAFEELAQKKAIVDEIDASARLREFSVTQGDEMQRIEQLHRDDPYSGVEEYKNNLTQTVNTFLGGIKDPNVKRLVASQSNNIVDRNLKQMITNAYKQNVVNVADRVNSEVTKVAGRILSNPEDLDFFTNEVRALQGLVDKAALIFDAKEGKKFKENIYESLALSLTNGLKHENPLLGLEILNKRHLDGLLSHNPNLINSERDALRQAADGWEKRRTYNNIASLSRVADEIVKEWFSGDLKNISQIEQAEVKYLQKQEEAKQPILKEHVRGFSALKKLVNEQKFADARDVPQLIGKFEEELQSIKLFQGDDVQFQKKLLNFKIDLMEAASKGELEESTWTSYLKSVATEDVKTTGLPTGDLVDRAWYNVKRWAGYSKKLPETAEGFGTAKITNFINDFSFPDAQDKLETHSKMRKTLIKETNEIERSGKPLTNELVFGIANRLINEEIKKRNPEILNKVEGDLIYSNGFWYETVKNNNGTITFQQVGNLNKGK